MLTKEPAARFPLTVSSGSASAKIYRVRNGTAQDGREYAIFTVAFSVGGKRQLRKFSDLKRAKAEAQRVVIAIGNSDGMVAALDSGDAADLVILKEKIGPLGVTLQGGADVLAEAAGLVGVHRIVEACRAFAQRHPGAREKLPLAKTADDFVDAKLAQGRSPRHLGDITSRLGRFVQDYPGHNVGDFAAPTIQRWLDGLRGSTGATLSAQTRKNFATVLSGFFEFCRRRGMIIDNPMRDVEREQVKNTGGVEFYTPEETAKLLAAAPVKLAPAIAIAFFAGVRTAELCRLAWVDIDFEQGHISLGADKSKTAARRLVPILANLQEWLLPYRGAARAHVWTETPEGYTRSVTEACAAAGVRRIENGTRHSFVSYRVAQTGDVARTALEAGNSAQMIFRHYRGLATKEASGKFFNIRPPAAR
ncbi:MAG: hypothetical protein EXS36_16515 [Pedosphaera sp.]|nr:hypothetical protein [Pedosphaera sp.]